MSGKKPRNVEERFWEKVDRSDVTGCWPWTGQLTNATGRGQFRWNKPRKKKSAHRVAYELMCGPIPEGMLVCHRCDNPICCNPSHLFLGTPHDNMNDMVLKGRAKGPSGEKHGVKLTPELVAQIRSAIGSNREIARRFNVSPQHVGRVKSGTTWAHIPLASLNIH